MGKLLTFSNYLFFSLFTMTALTAFATAFASNGNTYASLSAGGSWGRLANTNPQITYHDGFLNDAYPLHGNDRSAALLGVSVGYEFEGMRALPAIALGLGAYGAPGQFDYDGQVITTALGDPSFHLYNYTFYANTARLMAETRFTWVLNGLAPFVDAGLGIAWTRLGGYTESIVDAINYVALPSFQARTNSNFAYQVGAGVGYAFTMSDNQCARVSIGYRYANLGEVSFGTRGAMYPYSLDMGRMSLNEVYAVYTHLF